MLWFSKPPVVLQEASWAKYWWFRVPHLWGWALHYLRCSHWPCWTLRTVNQLTFCPAPCTIDKSYVDGVSITHRASPRKHIWTYAAGLFENMKDLSTCPCTGGGTSPPAFVGSDYYCESALNGPPWHPPVLYSTDPLWDGQHCNGLERTCCGSPNLPWFRKKLPEPSTDELELRLCGDEPCTNEDIPIDLVELYIQWTIWCVVCDS